MQHVIDSVLNFFRGGPPITISDAQALEAAKQECARKGWTWDEQTSMQKQKGRVCFWTNSGRIGGNMFIEVDGQSGVVVKSGMTPK